MTLPKGWSETEPRSNRPGTWRFQVRSSKRFRVGTLRTVPLEGIKGVKLIAGKLRSGDPEISRHKGPDVMIPQAVIFLKPEWGEFRRALAWQESHFTAIGPTLENPSRFPARRGKYKILTVPEQHQLRIAKDTLRMADAGARIMGGMTKAEARAIIRKFLGAAALSFFDAADPPIDNPSIVGSDRRRSFGGELENPPRAVQASRAAASVAIDKLVHIETEISALFVQALELQSRGERMPDWMADRIRGAQLEKKAALEDVRQAVGRHGATIEEFHVPRSRRANPSARGGRAAAVKLYQEFHGVAPKGFTTRNVPDLSQLVHLGRALRVDYQAARPRGPRGTPYRHAFDAGSELFTDRTGRALVILGNIKVSRAPRGRFGYIRAGAGE